MKKLFFIVCFSSFYLALSSQTVTRNFKKFNDTTFKVGDIILSPPILFELGKCELKSEGKDTIKYISDFLIKHIIPNPNII